MERRVRHALEVSRAYSSWNRQDDALSVLLDAEQMAPETASASLPGPPRTDMDQAAAQQAVIGTGRPCPPSPRARLIHSLYSARCDNLRHAPDGHSTRRRRHPLLRRSRTRPAGEARRVLLVKPAYKEGWDIPGGYVEPEESPRAARATLYHYWLWSASSSFRTMAPARCASVSRPFWSMAVYRSLYSSMAGATASA